MAFLIIMLLIYRNTLNGRTREQLECMMFLCLLTIPGHILDAHASTIITEECIPFPAALLIDESLDNYNLLSVT